MTAEEIKEIVKCGETSTIQFKLLFKKVEDIANELIAYSNSYGGRIFIGINDKTGEIVGLSYKQNHTTWHFQLFSLGVVLSKFISVRSCRMIFVLILRFIYFLCVWVLTWIKVCALRCMQCPRMPKEGNGCPGTGVRDTWELPLSVRNWTHVLWKSSWCS